MSGKGDDLFADFKFYHYSPSLGAAAAFAALFSLTTAAHIWQVVRGRTWYFIPFVVGGLFEVIGYTTRSVSIQQGPDYATVPYATQSVGILLGPALFAASIYMILGRIVRLTGGEERAVVPPGWLTKLFVGGDVLSFCMQGAGGGLIVTAKDKAGMDLAENVIIAGLFVQIGFFGLFVQIGFFGLFVVTSAVFHVRILRQPTAASQHVGAPWQRYLSLLYAASGSILLRSVFRAVEYIQGDNGYLLSVEAFLYVFDAGLMLVTMLLFNVWHPGAIMMGRGKAKLARPDDSEVVGREGSDFELVERK